MILVIVKSVQRGAPDVQITVPILKATISTFYVSLPERLGVRSAVSPPNLMGSGSRRCRQQPWGWRAAPSARTTTTHPEPSWRCSPSWRRPTGPSSPTPSPWTAWAGRRRRATPGRDRTPRRYRLPPASPNSSSINKQTTTATVSLTMFCRF